MSEMGRSRRGRAAVSRSGGDPADTYAETTERLDMAIRSSEGAQSVLAVQVRVASETAEHYGAVVRAYQLRLAALESVIADAALLAGPAVRLADTARRMLAVARRSELSARRHLDAVQSRKQKVAELVSQLRMSKFQLKLAQTANASQDRLRSLEASFHDVPVRGGGKYEAELREAARLAREAEALAELKGGWS